MKTAFTNSLFLSSVKIYFNNLINELDHFLSHVFYTNTNISSKNIESKIGKYLLGA